jgi:hypothetical protein
MCNLYNITTNQAAIIALFRVINRYVGNLPPIPGVFPDYPAPVIHNADAGTEMVTMRWGMPPHHFVTNGPQTKGPPGRPTVHSWLAFALACAAEAVPALHATCAPEGRRLMPVFLSPLGPCPIGRLSLWALVARDARSISLQSVNTQAGRRV